MGREKAERLRQLIHLFGVLCLIQADESERQPHQRQNSQRADPVNEGDGDIEQRVFRRFPLAAYQLAHAYSPPAHSHPDEGHHHPFECHGGDVQRDPAVAFDHAS